MSDTKLNQSFDKLKDYLTAYSLRGSVDRQRFLDLLRSVHKRVYGLLCWHLAFENTGRGADIDWLRECVSDFLHVLLLLSQGMYKVASMVHRSAIENFARYLFLRARPGGELPNSTYQLFDLVTGTVSEVGNPELEARYNLLHQSYGDLCSYVHSANVHYQSLVDALGEYPAFNGDAAGKAAERIGRDVRAILGILLVLEPAVFSSMYHENKDALLDNLSASEKRALITAAHSAVFTRG